MSYNETIFAIGGSALLIFALILGWAIQKKRIFMRSIAQLSTEERKALLKECIKAVLDQCNTASDAIEIEKNLDFIEDDTSILAVKDLLRKIPLIPSITGSFKLFSYKNEDSNIDFSLEFLDFEPPLGYYNGVLQQRFVGRLKIKSIAVGHVYWVDFINIKYPVTTT